MRDIKKKSKLKKQKICLYMDESIKCINIHMYTQLVHFTDIWPFVLIFYYKHVTFKFKKTELNYKKKNKYRSVY